MSYMAVFYSDSALQTRKWAEDYAKTLHAGDVVLLDGEMGAGKTVIAQGIARGLGISESVTSPTYAYVNSYEDKLFHFDCYRICSERQAFELGFADYFEQNAVCLVEWSENIKGLLPSECKRVEIRKCGETQREILF